MALEPKGIHYGLDPIVIISFVANKNVVVTTPCSIREKENVRSHVKKNIAEERRDKLALHNIEQERRSKLTVNYSLT